MATVLAPSQSAFLPSPLLSSPIAPAAKTPRLANGRRQKQCGRPSSKTAGVMKPKQTKSRDGCSTCKAKRLKCDETKPSCEQCRKRNVTCGGYKKNFKWRAFEETTFTTKPIPSPTPPNATVPPWPQSTNPMMLPTNTLVTVGEPSPGVSAPADGQKSPQTSMFSGLATPSYGHARTAPKSLSTPPSSAHRDRPSYDASDSEHLSSPQYSEFALEPGQDDWMLKDGNIFHTAKTASNITRAESTLSEQECQSLPELITGSSTMDATLVQESPIFLGQAIRSQSAHGSLGQGGDLEALTPLSPDASSWQVCLASPSFLQSPLPSTGLTLKLPNIRSWPKLSSTGPEMFTQRFDRSTCGILSVKDGPTENPWRTMIWPLAHDSPALYHALISMTAFHNSKNNHQLRIEGVAHMKRSLKYLRREMENKSIDVDAALATTLALAFAESWDLHISTGVLHLRGAVSLMHHAIAQREKRSLTLPQMERLRFLFSTWVYMDVIARLTSVDVDESDHFGFALNTCIGPQKVQSEVDPLMGCAATLFPLIGRVANLVRLVFRSARNSIRMISYANDLKVAIEAWQPPNAFETPEDASSDVQHCLDTAEAYRWATLLYLHQAVPEIPSRPSEELAGKVMVYLLRVPVESRLVIVHIYPLLAAGCEVVSNEDRAWVEDRWAAMMQRMLIGNLDRCWEVVKEVWDRRDLAESRKARLALRTVHAGPASGGQERLHGGFGFDDSVPHDIGPASAQSGQLSNLAPDLQSPAASGIQRIPSEVIEDLDYDRTVRGRLHWVGVMKDWKWEILLG
ncbi:MAG: hypothetical protein Q9222_003415 [Ikaeria aurantiellina]